MASVFDLVIGTYITIYARAAEPQGALYWINQLGYASLDSALDAEGSLALADQLGKQFYDVSSAVFDATYPSTMRNYEFLNNVYLNLGGRPADAEGALFWGSRLTDLMDENDPQVARSIVAAEIGFVLQTYDASATGDAATRAETYKNKLAISRATALSGNDSFNPEEQSMDDPAYAALTKILLGIDEISQSKNIALEQVVLADKADDPSLMVGGDPTPEPSPTADKTPPTMISAAVSTDGFSIIITYNEAVAGTLESNDWSFNVSGMTYTGTITGATIGAGSDANKVAISLSVAIAQSVAVSNLIYSASNGTQNSLIDTATPANAGLPQTLASITNNSTSNNAPVVSGAVTGVATEDGPSVTLNALANATDADGNTLSVVNVPDSLPAGVTYNAGEKTFTLDPTNGIYQRLASGQTSMVTVNYGVSDGTATTAASAFWTVIGANDAPTVSGPVTGTAIEDGSAVTLNALANASDVDAGTTLSVVNVPSTMPSGVTYDASRTSFTLDPSNAAYQSLAAGATTTVTVNYDVSDGTATSAASASWTVTGIYDAPSPVSPTNIAPVVSGAVTGFATEGGLIVALNALANASDADGDTLSGTNVPSPLPAGVTYDASTKSFTLDPTNAAYQSLAAGQTSTVTVNYDVSDGAAITATTVLWTVTGINDAPTVSGPVTGTAIEDGSAVTLNALANASDVDAGTTLSVVNVPSTMPSGVTYDASTTSFTLDPSNAAYQSLAAGATTTVTVNYDVSDGITTTAASASWTVTGIPDITAPIVTTAISVSGIAVTSNEAGTTTIGATTVAPAATVGTFTVAEQSSIAAGLLTVTDASSNVGTDTSGRSYTIGTAIGEILNGRYVWGWAGNDSISGTIETDYLYGGADNDTITGGAGADEIDGGGGDDVFNYTNNQQLAIDSVVIGGDGFDTIAFSEAINTIIWPETNGIDFHRDFSKVTGVERIQLFGSSHVNLGVVLPGAGVTTIATGDDNTTLRYDNIAVGLMTVDATALADNKTLTLTGYTVDAGQWFNVTELKGDVNAADVLGNISVTTATGTGFDVAVVGGWGNDTLVGGAGNDTISGRAGADTITGGAGTDTLYGQDGNDTLIADDTDVLDGGANTDTVRFGAAVSTNLVDTDLVNVENIVITNTGNATYDLSAQTEILNITGGDGGDAITGGSAGDTISGSNGNDTITGGAGKDEMYGGAGDDVFIIATAADHGNTNNGEKIYGDAGVDVIRFASTTPNEILTLSYWIDVEEVRIVAADGSENSTAGLGINADWLGVGPNIKLYGNAGNNSLVGNGDGINIIDGGAGADSIRGGQLSDTLTAGAGDDTLTGGAGSDTFYVDSGTDTITDLGNGADIVVISSGATANITATGAWTATASTNNAGTATVTTNGYDIDVSAATGSGGWTLTNSGGAATLTGSAFGDTLTGGAGNDSVYGGEGSDTINAGDGNDYLEGGFHADTLTGGAGADQFHIKYWGLKTITDLGHGADTLNTEGGTSVDATVVANWAPIKDTFNQSTVENAIIRVGGTFTVNLSSDNYANGFTIISTGTGAITGTSTVNTGDHLVNQSGDATFTGGAGADKFSALADFMTITDLNGGDIVVVSAGATANIIATSSWMATSASSNGGTANITTNGFAINVSSAIGPNGWTLTNSGAAAILIGSSQADIVTGGSGNDTITGGAGADIFVFNSLVGTDTITDYSVSDDSIELSLSAYGALGAVREFASSDFASIAGVTAATDTSSQAVIYDSAAGNLYYNADGATAGGLTLIATFTSNPTLVYTEFTIIA